MVVTIAACSCSGSSSAGTGHRWICLGRHGSRSSSGKHSPAARCYWPSPHTSADGALRSLRRDGFRRAVLRDYTGASDFRTRSTAASFGSGAMLKPSFRHIFSIGLFSCSTSPTSSLSGNERRHLRAHLGALWDQGRDPRLHDPRVEGRTVTRALRRSNGTTCDRCVAGAVSAARQFSA
jgi:hypothetical protein